MKTNPLGPFLVGVFVACAVVTLWLALRYHFAVNELIKLNIKMNTMSQTRNVVQSLASEAMEYSRRNPAIDPILEKFELKTRATNNPAATNLQTSPRPGGSK